MGDSDARNALARRLQRPVSEGIVVGKPEQVASKLTAPTASCSESSTNGTMSIDAISIRVEGFLYKYSSGHLARWQKRFFVLASGKFSYFKRVPLDKDVPNKSFSVLRIKLVNVKEGPSADDREFSLAFSNGKSYQMRAPTSEEKRKWVHSLRGAIAFMESHPGGVPDDEDGGGISDDGFDGMTSINGSVVSETSPRDPQSPCQSSEHKLSSRLHVLLPRRESIAGVIHLAASGLTSLKPSIPGLSSPVQDTSMLEVEVDPDSLDKNFEEWFYFVSEENLIDRKVQMSQIMEACQRANNHLWCTLANLPRGTEDLRLEEAIGRAKARMGGGAAVERASIIVEEYMSRISKSVGRALDLRRDGKSSDLPQLMDCVSRIFLSIDKLLPIMPPETRCVCCYCDPSGVALLKLERAHGGRKGLTLPPVACSGDKWRRLVRSIVQRIGGELEVGLIEDLQHLILSAEDAWNGPSCNQPLSAPHGPCPQQHPLLDDLDIRKISSIVGKQLLAPLKVALTSFGPAFVQASQAGCLNAASQWMAAYPSSARLIAEHTSSALVASVNSVWRTFKRQAGVAAERASEEQSKKNTESTRVARDELLKRKEIFTDLDHLVAFANECVLISRFCAKTWSNGVTSKFTPEVFLTCMEGLASGFLATAADVCHTIVLLHLSPRIRYDLIKLLSPKCLVAHKQASPMVHGKILADQFVSAVEVCMSITCVRDGVVALIAPALLRAYVAALVKNKPRVKSHKSLPETLREDLDLFRSFMDQTLHVPPSQLSLPFQIAQEIQNLMVERNRSNFSIHFNSIAKLANSKHDAFVAVSSFIKMREYEWTLSTEKKEIAAIVSSMKSVAASESKQPCEDDSVQEALKHADSSDPQVKKGKNGVTIITLHVGDLKAPWKLED